MFFCPDLGIEAVNARDAYRRLADRFAKRGLPPCGSTLREPEIREANRAIPGVSRHGCAAFVATDLVRGLQLPRVGVVGLRMGATFVAQIFGSGPPAMTTSSCGTPAPRVGVPAGAGRIMAFTLGAGQRRRLDRNPRLCLRQGHRGRIVGACHRERGGSDGGSGLGPVRAGRKGDRAMNERLALPHVDHREISGRRTSSTCSPTRHGCRRDTRRMVDWLGARAGSGSARSKRSTQRRGPDSAAVGQRVAWRSTNGADSARSACSGSLPHADARGWPSLVEAQRLTGKTPTSSSSTPA